jgi:hypothetical protein
MGCHTRTDLLCHDQHHIISRHFTATAKVPPLRLQKNLPIEANNDNGYLSYNIILIITPPDV